MRSIKVTKEVGEVFRRAWSFFNMYARGAGLGHISQSEYIYILCKSAIEPRHKRKVQDTLEDYKKDLI